MDRFCRQFKHYLTTSKEIKIKPRFLKICKCKVDKNLNLFNFRNKNKNASQPLLKTVKHKDRT